MSVFIDVVNAIWNNKFSLLLYTIPFVTIWLLKQAFSRSKKNPRWFAELSFAFLALVIFDLRKELSVIFGYPVFWFIFIPIIILAICCFSIYKHTKKFFKEGDDSNDTKKQAS